MSEITIIGEKKIKTDINESVDTNIYSGVAEEHKELITKQIVISPSIYEAHLIPVTAPEDDINQIQAHIDKLEKLLKGYLRLTNEVEAEYEEVLSDLERAYESRTLLTDYMYAQVDILRNIVVRLKSIGEEL